MLARLIDGEKHVVFPAHLLGGKGNGMVCHGDQLFALVVVGALENRVLGQNNLYLSVRSRPISQRILHTGAHRLPGGHVGHVHHHAGSLRLQQSGKGGCIQPRYGEGQRGHSPVGDGDAAQGVILARGKPHGGQLGVLRHSGKQLVLDKGHHTVFPGGKLGGLVVVGGHSGIHQRALAVKHQYPAHVGTVRHGDEPTSP